MSNPTTPPDPNPYLTGGAAFDQKWTDQAYELQQQGKIEARIVLEHDVATEVVSGPCPRCGDGFDYTRVASTPVVKGPAASSGDWWTVLVECGCTRSHEGQPPKAVGCGARYNLSAAVVTAS